jgi:DNA-3-methyladenine glycosylase I
VADARPRCWWANSDPLLAADHDQAWGVPVTDDTSLFEMLTLESFQAGLSWLTILRKRDAFRRGFGGFDPGIVSRFDERDVERLMGDPGIVRNRAKIEAAIANARALLEISAAFGSFHSYVTSFVGSPPPTLPPTAEPRDVPATTPVSDALSRDMKRRGFRFVGSTIVYAFLQAAGFVDDHLPGCFRYRGPAATRAHAGRPACP